MDDSRALKAFAALSQETRLRIVRLLVQAGPQGMAAGAIGDAMDGASTSRMSFHLSQLEHASLVQSRREGRSIIYSASYPALSDLIQFLMRDCCHGHPEVCPPTGDVPDCVCESASDSTDNVPSARGQKTEGPMDIVIYHNPACGTSRNTLAMIRNAGIEPHVVEYLKTPPSRDILVQVIARMGLPARALLREKETPYAALGLGDPDLSDDQLVDAMLAHPVLINRPIVVSPMGVRLCRPSETVLDLLPPLQGEFIKEDGERVVHERGPRVATA